VGKKAVVGTLDIYQKAVKKATIPGNHAPLRIHWQHFAAFTKWYLYHPGVPLHEVLADYRLQIIFDLTKDRSIPGTMNNLVEEVVSALTAFALNKPQPITLNLSDHKGDQTTELECLFRKLSEPFYLLHSRGFDVRVTYFVSTDKDWALGNNG
jgi:hypothetical protein